MLRKIWIVLGAVALVTSASNVGPFAGDEHPPADIAHAGDEFDRHRQANLATDGMFAPGLSYSVGDSPNSVAVGDFDQDGRPDLVTANPGSDNVTVLLGRGDGTFAAGVSYEAGDEPYSVAVGDFDQDGRPDLVTANFGALSRDVTVLLGNGDGTFAAGVSYEAGDRPSSVAVGDFDQDGQPDLVTTIWLSDAVTVLLGNGDGTFAAPLSYEAGYGPHSVAVGDFDQDGRQDLLTKNEPLQRSLSVTVLLGYGDGTFGPAVSYSTGGGVPGDGALGANEVAVGDFNQDGWPDVVTTDWYTYAATVLLGHGDGTFGPPVSYATGGFPSSVAVGDLNQDGWPDLVAANYLGLDGILDSGVVAVLLGHGDGTFAGPLSYDAGYGPWSVAVGDFDRDGWPDLVAANYAYPSGLNGTVTVLLNQIEPLPINLEIKPDGFPNSISPYSRGVTPVAILGSDIFDVACIDVTTLAFGPGRAAPTHNLTDSFTYNDHLQDVNYDGIMDLLTHYRTRDTGIACGDESATLIGETLGGQPFEGTDSIQTVGCRETRRPAIWMKDEDQEAEPAEGRVIDIRKR